MSAITLEEIRRPIEGELKLFDDYVIGAFNCDSPLMGDMLTAAISSRGKGVRPTLAILSSAMHLFEVEASERSIGNRAWIAAMMAEMIHLASLIHDDVIDNSNLRRGVATINAQWQSRNAILTGDYILGRTLSLGMQSGHYDIVEHLSGVISTLCEGEVIQSHYASTLDIGVEEYISIARKKTSALISASCSAGAIAAGASPQRVASIAEYGDNVGIAFQIQDDIIDFCPSSQSGKTSNNDLREGKITLPLLLLLEKSQEQDRESLKQLLRDCANCEKSVAKLHSIIQQSGAIERAEEIMDGYISRAITILNDYSPSPFRESLTQLAHFIKERTK